MKNCDEKAPSPCGKRAMRLTQEIFKTEIDHQCTPWPTTTRLPVVQCVTSWFQCMHGQIRSATTKINHQMFDLLLFLFWLVRICDLAVTSARRYGFCSVDQRFFSLGRTKNTGNFGFQRHPQLVGIFERTQTGLKANIAHKLFCWLFPNNH